MKIEYINKHEAYRVMKDLEAAYIYPPISEAFGTAAIYINQIPTADVQPVKHGSWKFRGSGSPEFTFRCSCCENIAPEEYSFCPNCGAKMDKDRI